ncbi:hypothetical protein CCP3SC1_540023 [Gammaproteobacteria bacterium]
MHLKITQVATYAVRNEKAPLPPGEGRKSRGVATWVKIIVTAYSFIDISPF